jgi:hypothetical protein
MTIAEALRFADAASLDVPIGMASHRKRQFCFSSFGLPIHFGNWRFVHRKSRDD